MARSSSIERSARRALRPMSSSSAFLRSSSSITTSGTTTWCSSKRMMAAGSASGTLVSMTKVWRSMVRAGATVGRSVTKGPRRQGWGAGWRAGSCRRRTGGAADRTTGPGPTRSGHRRPPRRRRRPGGTASATGVDGARGDHAAGCAQWGPGRGARRDGMSRRGMATIPDLLRGRRDGRAVVPPGSHLRRMGVWRTVGTIVRRTGASTEPRHATPRDVPGQVSGRSAGPGWRSPAGRAGSRSGPARGSHWCRGGRRCGPARASPQPPRGCGRTPPCRAANCAGRR